MRDDVGLDLPPKSLDFKWFGVLSIDMLKEIEDRLAHGAEQSDELSDLKGIDVMHRSLVAERKLCEDMSLVEGLLEA